MSKHNGFRRKLSPRFGCYLDCPANRFVQVGTLTEEIVVRGADGKLLSRANLAMDDAYRLTGQHTPVHDPLSGIARVLWGSVSRKGELFVCLSGLSAAKPAYVGVFDPMTGRAVRVIEAQLPRVPARVDKYNPEGQIYPIHGAADDRLVIVDEPLGIIAVYKMN